MEARYPTDRELVAALRSIAEALDEPIAYVHEGLFHWPFGNGWSLAVSPDSACRIRLDACFGTAARATLWSEASDRVRLADLAIALRHEVHALA
jgi:hypothetical protein